MQIIAELAIIIGHAVANIIPYITKKTQPIELMILSHVTLFIKKETSKVVMARYPTQSVIVMSRNSIVDNKNKTK